MKRFGRRAANPAPFWYDFASSLTCRDREQRLCALLGGGPAFVPVTQRAAGQPTEPVALRRAA